MSAPQLVAADLNTLPTSVVQRIEILREGASSIYGSDAIAGVINVITDTKINGITIDAYADIPEIGAGQTLRGSITAGKVFDRGHIMASFEYRQDKGLEFGDRKDTRCAPRTRLRHDGHEVGQHIPSQPNCAAIPMHAPVRALLPATVWVLGGLPGRTPARISFAGYNTG